MNHSTRSIPRRSHLKVNVHVSLFPPPPRPPLLRSAHTCGSGHQSDGHKVGPSNRSRFSKRFTRPSSAAILTHFATQSRFATNPSNSASQPRARLWDNEDARVEVRSVSHP